MNTNPIGIFDSGVGGLTVWTQVRHLLPHEDFVYLADSKNCPYGSKSQDEIIELSVRNTEFLLKQNCKLIIVACNTATAAAIDYLRKHYIVPFIGMEPATKPAALNTSTGNIGILATRGTFNGRLFKETKKKYARQIKTFIQPGDGLVELVESNQYLTSEALQLLKKYVDPMMDAQVDQIVLGCTHYPFFMPLLKQIAGPSVTIVDPAPAIAIRTQHLLKEFDIENNNGHPGSDIFYSNGNSRIIHSLVKQLLPIEAMILNQDDYS